MYGKLFQSMYDGTLVEDWRALVTFQQMVILCDADGVLDMTAKAISNRTGIPLDYIQAGIEILESTDPSSRTKSQEGRRIVLIDEHRTWGWYIVNHNKYKMLVDADTVRAQNRLRKQRQRGNASHNVTHGHDEVTHGHDGHAMSRHTDTNTNTDINIKDQVTMSGKNPPDPPQLNKKIQFKKHAALILDYFNEVVGKHFEAVDANLNLIANRLEEAEGVYHSIDDSTLLCRRVILDRKKTWECDENMHEYLRPKTIFAKANFWNYSGGLPESMQMTKSIQVPLNV